MKTITAGLIVFIVSVPALAVVHENKPVGAVSSPDDRPCTFFTLTGANIADSAVNNSGGLRVL